jgi:integrase
MNTKAISRLRNGAIAKAGNVPGFYARKRGDRTVWLLRYAGPKGVQREFIFGYLNTDGVTGQLASAVAFEAIGERVDFEAALLASKGAREPIPPQHAEIIARKLRSMIEAGRDLVAELKQKRQEAAVEDAERVDRSVKAVGERWVRHLRREGKKSAAEVGRILERHVYRRIGAKDIGKVGRADAHRVHDALVDAGKAPMAAMVARLLRAMMSYAADRGLVPVNPLLRMKLGGTNARKRILIKCHPERKPDPAELMAVWVASDALPSPRGEFVKVLILSLQRLRKVGRMRWDEIDGSLWRIPPERHKGGRGHEVPLPAQVLANIHSLAEPEARQPGKFVFEGRGGRPIGDFSGLKEDLDAAILAAARKADPEPKEMPHWVLHDLRRTGATWLREVGFFRDDVEDVLGHSMPALVSTYQRGPAYQRRKAALAAWADFVTGAEAANLLPMRA